MKVIFLIIVGISLVLGAEDFEDSGLIWQNDSVKKRSWKSAKGYCKRYGYKRHGHYYRLPTIKELQSTINIPKYEPAKGNMPIHKGFKFKSNYRYFWSSSGVSYSIRHGEGKYYKNYTRCVKSR